MHPTKPKNSSGGRVAAVIPNLNGGDYLIKAVRSLQAQSYKCDIVVIDNNSTDKSLASLQTLDKTPTIIEHDKNYGFAGGVNIGIDWAQKNGYEFVLIFNNDAEAEPDYLEKLLVAMDDQSVAMANGLSLRTDDQSVDSTGVGYSLWGQSFPIDRGKLKTEVSKDKNMLGVSGGASLFRSQLFKEIGGFDEDFFAYYEDVDLSFRAQLRGWQARYVAAAVVHHQVGKTTRNWKGFTTYQTFKNLPMLHLKNLPLVLYLFSLPRFVVFYWILLVSAVIKGRGLSAIKGMLMSWLLFPKKLVQRWQIQHQRTATIRELARHLSTKWPPS